MTEKVLKVLISRLEEAAVYNHIHKNDIWLEQLEKSRVALLNAFKDQLLEVDQLEKKMDGALFYSNYDFPPDPKTTFKLK